MAISAGSIQAEKDSPDELPADLAKLRLENAVAPAAREVRLAGILAICGPLLWYAQAALVAGLISQLAGGPEGFLAPVSAIAAFVVLGLLRTAVDWFAGGAAFRAADKVMACERENLLAAQSIRSEFAPGPVSAEIASLASEKIATLGPFVSRYLSAMARTRILPLVILGAAFANSWVAGIILLVTGPLIPLFMALVGMKARDASEEQLREVATMNAMLSERLRALTDIRLLDAASMTIRRFEAVAGDLRERTMRVLAIAFLSSTVLELFAAIGVALMAVYVGFALLGEIGFGTWGAPLNLFQGILLLLLAPEFYAPLRELAAAWHDRAAALAVAGELENPGSREDAAILGRGEPAAPLPFSRDIEIAGVGLTHTGAREITFPDVIIRKGGSIALVGPSGSGKSTLLALIAGLVPVGSGSILIDGKVLDSSNADAWRQNLSWVSQTPQFLDATLEENLLLGIRDGVSSQDITQALEAADALGIVDRLPGGLDARLGETGHGVSGGEARRLMIAAAILRGAPVVLADEPTADLDAATAKAVTASLVGLAAGGNTVIVATHDMELAARMDRSIEIGAAQ
jgi:ATP-binding cassette subfamily C protein CydD